MAGDGLIDGYLAALHARTRGRADQRDLIDEIADHLLSAAERLEQRGVPRAEAESRALTRLGDPRLVASLLTSTPSKGTVLSLFFARRLGIFAGLAAVAWALAAVSTYYGFTALSGSWSKESYLTSAMLVATACLLTTAVLLGVNIRARGRVDAGTVWIVVIALLATAVASVLAWAVAIWLPLLAAAVTWTCIRARRAHAGSPAFATALAVLSPLLGVAVIGVSVYGVIVGDEMDLAIWASVAALGVLLIAGFVDIAARVKHTFRQSTTAA